MIYIVCNRLSFQKTAFTATAVLLTVFTATTFAQTDGSRTKNNPYFPSPNAKAKQEEPPRVPVSHVARASVSTVARHDTEIEIRPAVAQRTYKTVKNVEARSSSPVDFYKIGVGDIVYVNLKNAANASGYYTVKTNGMIDFPLAGDKLVVTNRTADEVADMLAAGITLYADPRVEVKVREYRSHKISVSGMVEQSGESSLQREAVPLYVICAQSGVEAKATKAVVRRSDLAQIETFDLHDANSDKILIYPGDSVEFIADSRNAAPVTKGFYYIAGNVNSAGQKEFTPGMTLSQAILASGGAKGNPKKATIRRQSDNGPLNIAEHDLRAIKGGKTPDPILSPGDMIEIRN